MTNALAKLDKATQMLAEAKSLDEIKYIMDVAEAARTYARAAKLGLDAYNHAAEVKVRAERKAGEFLVKLERGGGGDRRTENFKCNMLLLLKSEYREVLEQQAISRQTASRWQTLAAMPEDEFEQHIEDTRGEKPITTSGIIKEIKLEKAHERHTEQTRASQTFNPLVEICDAVEWMKKQKPCDLLFTDPPYSTDVDDIALFSSWITTALEKVKPTGRAYIFIGAYPEEVKAYLNKEIPKHIELSQMLIWEYKNTLGNNPKDRYKLNYQICLYYKGIDAPELNCPITSEQWAVMSFNAPDGRQGDRYHTWQKPLDMAEMIVRHSTKEGDIVYDPFACTGTFLLAAGKLGRKAYGCDISEENLTIAIERGCKHA